MLVACCNEDGALLEASGADVSLLLDMETRGIAYIGDRLYAASGDGRSKLRGIHELDTGQYGEMRIVNSFWASEDWHGLATDHRMLYAASTAADEIVTLTPELEEVDRFRWHDRVDIRMHTNDLWWDGALMWTSFHGGLSSRYRTLASPKAQPHSGQRHGSALWACESLEGRVVRYIDDGKETIYEIDGEPRFTRGLLLQDEFFWVGVSAARHQDRETRGELHCVNYAGRLLRKIQLPCAEVYTMIEGRK